MIVKNSDVRGRDLYEIAMMSKANVNDIDANTEIVVLHYAITEGKYQDGLVLVTADGAYFTNDRPLVDTFRTILSCYGFIPKLKFDIKTSNNTGKIYRTFVPID